MKLEATVVRVDGGIAWIAVETHSTCGRCPSNKACGSGVLSELLGKRTLIPVSNRLGAAAGQVVTIAMADDLLLRAAGMAYLLPIALASLAAGVAAGFGLADGLTALSALIGLLAGLLVTRSINNSPKAAVRLRPRLLQRQS